MLCYIHVTFVLDVTVCIGTAVCQQLPPSRELASKHRVQCLLQFQQGTEIHHLVIWCSLLFARAIEQHHY